MIDQFREIALSLVAVAHSFHARGWIPGSSGNLSAVVERDPLRLAMSPSGLDKEVLRSEQVLLIDERASTISNHCERPSAESPLHIRIVKDRGAGAVLHTHSVWSTILSDLHADDGGFAIEGYEMLKGLENVETHKHREWLPVLENSQDMILLADRIGETLKLHGEAHGFLVRRHGLYTWGKDLVQAKRHVEIIEFLLEAEGRSRLISTRR